MAFHITHRRSFRYGTVYSLWVDDRPLGDFQHLDQLDTIIHYYTVVRPGIKIDHIEPIRATARTLGVPTAPSRRTSVGLTNILVACTCYGLDKLARRIALRRQFS